jgi:hypothetical protein
MRGRWLNPVLPLILSLDAVSAAGIARGRDLELERREVKT